MVKTMKQNRLSLNDVEWREFKINDIFEIYLSKGDNKADLLDCGNIPLISSGFNNNGITKFIDSGDGISEIIPKNTITVDMFGKSFYQDFDYYAVSHGRINILSPLYELNKNHLLFCINSIDNATKNIFSYNRMCSSSRLSKLKILLPVDGKGNPNWQFMENFIKQEMSIQAKKVVDYYNKMLMAFERERERHGAPRLDDIEWGEFLIGELFDIQGSTTTHPSKLIKNGKTPRVTTAAINNGYDDFYKNNPTEKGGVLAVDSATIGYVSYQPVDFIATDHVEKISLKNNLSFSKNIALFLKVAIDKSKSNKFGYGYKFSQFRIKKQIIKLPKNNLNNPNYKFMENFTKQEINLLIVKIKNYLTNAYL